MKREGEKGREKERWEILVSFDPARNALLLFYSACVCMCVHVCSAWRRRHR